MALALGVIRFYQLLDVLCMFYSIFQKKRKDVNCLTVASWVYYFCSIVSFLFCFTLYEEIIADVENRSLEFIILFSIAIFTMICMMLVQKIWCVKYDDKELIFRNSFGVTRKYNINELSLVEKERMSEIHFKGKKIIEWDTLIVNFKQDLELSKFFHRKSLK